MTPGVEEGRVGEIASAAHPPAPFGALGQTSMDALLDALAERVAARLADRLAEQDGSAPWLDSREAAEYLRLDPRTGPKRVSELQRAGHLRCARDGTRLLFRREWLDAYLEGRGA